MEYSILKRIITMIEDLIFEKNVLWELVEAGSDVPTFSKILSLDETGEIVYEEVSSDELLSIPDGEYSQHVTTVTRKAGTTWRILPEKVVIGTDTP